jgi:hypothetical protein
MVHAAPGKHYLALTGTAPAMNAWDHSGDTQSSSMANSVMSTNLYVPTKSMRLEREKGLPPDVHSTQAQAQAQARHK